MLRKIYILFTGLLVSMTLSGQNINGIEITGISVTTDGETITVSFEAKTHSKAAGRGITMIYSPVLSNGIYRVSLPVMVVQGKKAAKDWRRHEWAAGETARFDNAINISSGKAFAYRAEVPFQQWMYDAWIEIETVAAGCCNSHVSQTVLLSDIFTVTTTEPIPEPLVIETVPDPVPTVVTAVLEPAPTVGEMLEEMFPFVLPASDFDPNNPIMFYDDERDNALTVYYRIDSYDIDDNYADNRQTLVNLLAAIDLIKSSNDSGVERVVVAGFASPDGPFELNDRLAWERAVSVKKYIMDNTGLPDPTIMLFNGSADWRGLRLLVTQDENVPYRQQVLDIIDNHPIWDARTQTGRLTLLRNLNGGVSYRYLTEVIFPKLRNGAFIRVYFNVETD